MGTRSGLVYVAKTNPAQLPVLGRLAIFPAIGFMLIYIFKLRQTGPEVSGELIWWDELRPLHALLWGTFAYLALKSNLNAWKVLMTDTMVGFFSFVIHYMTK